MAAKWTEAVSIKEHKVECSILEVRILIFYKCVHFSSMSSLYHRKFLLSVHYKPNVQTHVRNKKTDRNVISYSFYFVTLKVNFI